MSFVESYDVENLYSAEYNPRKISKKQFERLKISILKFGILKPIIVNGSNNVLTAGHQRVRAIKELGIKKVPVIKLEKICQSDEIMFNLFHNSIETNLSEVNLIEIQDLSMGYHYIESSCINFSKNKNPIIVKEIGKLLIRYGAWGSVVCDDLGNVLCNSDYAVACKILNVPLLVYKLEENKLGDFNKYFLTTYGEYCFDKLGVKDYNQTFCQMNRLNGKKMLKSTTYIKYVLPEITKQQRVLDFGSGKCAYANMLKKQGYQISMYEPFFRKEGKNAFDISQIIGFIDEISSNIKKYGLYDVVVLDSVLNSITSLEMQHNVLLTCNALLKNDGKLILGTRSIGQSKLVFHQKKSTNNKRELEFLDYNNFSATFRNGVWTKQRFTTKLDLEKELNPYFENVEVFGNESRSNIYAICSKPIRWAMADYHKALNKEFNMVYPNCFKHNKHKTLVEIIKKILFEQ